MEATIVYWGYMVVIWGSFSIPSNVVPLGVWYDWLGLLFGLPKKYYIGGSR